VNGLAALTWLDGVREERGPVYAAIVRRLERAIRDGELSPGDRLPPQRALAERIGVDLTTVTRAYTTARERGLVEGAVGRGTFVRAPRDEDEAGLVDLSMNLPPPPEGLSLGRLLQETTSAILQRTDASALMSYHPGFGTPGQRAAGAEWLKPHLGLVETDRLLVSPGAQSALAAVLTATCRPGDVVVAEALTYPGFRSLAAQQGLRLLGCPADGEGIVPEHLERLCAEARPKAVYLIPTMQNPAATTMGRARRRAVADVIARAGAWLIEDDPYSRLLDTPLPALAALIPGRAFHVGTLSKCLSPGLRIAYLACPDAAWAARASDALRATALMPAPLMTAVATVWIREGLARSLLERVRSEACARRAVAADALPEAQGPTESLHVWLPLAGGRLSEEVRLSAQARGLAVVTQEAFAVTPDAPNGVRISLGGPSRRAVLAPALNALRDVVRGGGSRTRQIV
jgi:DNA-binding transcriptional MocR family regulator